MKLLLSIFILLFSKSLCAFLKSTNAQNEIIELTHQLLKLKKQIKFQNYTMNNLQKQIKLQTNLEKAMIQLNVSRYVKLPNCVNDSKTFIEKYEEIQFPFQHIPLKFWPKTETHITEYSFYQNMKFELQRKHKLEKYIENTIHKIRIKLDNIRKMTNSLNDDMKDLQNLINQTNELEIKSKEMQKQVDTLSKTSKKYTHDSNSPLLN